MTKPIVHIAHCIDTEGPLYEPIAATFERIRGIFDLELEPTINNLRRLQSGEMDLGGIEKDVARVISPELLAYNDTWDKVDAMLTDIMSPSFRNQMPDSFGGGWIYNWFCIDFVGFKTNPRRRDAGFHNIFDHYREMMDRTESPQDGVYFHHHPIPFSGEGNHSTSHYFSHAPIVFETLARRIIDRHWFPSANRPGFHTTRPDSHWLMEQHIPFDIASQACNEDYSAQKDLPIGRFGDWRRAPKNWQPYHPAHDDYQINGDCRRWIARCLNIGSRVRLLTKDDVDAAFREAGEGKPVVLSFTHHDFRDMRPAIDEVRNFIRAAANRHPGVDFRYCDAREAMRGALALEEKGPLHFDMSIDNNRLHIKANAPTFGPQPFLALKTRTGQYFHDNLDFQEPFREWMYYFDEQSIPLDAVEAVGVGACDATGNVTVTVINPATGTVVEKHS